MARWEKNVETDLYRTLADEADEPIILTDDRLDVVYLNHRARAEYGAQALGSPLGDVVPVDVGEAEPDAGPTWRVLRAGSHWAFFGQPGERATHGDGQANDPWLQQLLQAEQLAAVGQLSAAVVQEIGAPLTAIEMAADRLARRECEKCRIQDEDRELILAQTHRIAQLSRLLTNLAGPGAPHVRSVDVNEVVREVAEIMGRTSRDRIHSRLTLDESIPAIASDPRRVQQVLITLLSNAQNAMPAGGHLDVSTRLKGDWVELRVKDSGPGIPQEDLSRIFLPFFSRSGGTGLGLPLARQLVHSLGGTISVQTEVGEGSTFVVLLPTPKGTSSADRSDG